jgi:hypothetical protein
MKKISLILGLFVVCFLMQTISAMAQVDSATMYIRRIRDNRIVASSNGATYSYPNDRVARGEDYQVEIAYTTTNLFSGGYGTYLWRTVNGSGSRPNNTTDFFYVDQYYEYFISTRKTVSMSSSFSNVWFRYDAVYGQTIASVRLPIGSY